MQKCSQLVSSLSVVMEEMNKSLYRSRFRKKRVKVLFLGDLGLTIGLAGGAFFQQLPEILRHPATPFFLLRRQPIEPALLYYSSRADEFQSQFSQSVNINTFINNLCLSNHYVISNVHNNQKRMTKHNRTLRFLPVTHQICSLCPLQCLGSAYLCVYRCLL